MWLQFDASEEAIILVMHNVLVFIFVIISPFSLNAMRLTVFLIKMGRKVLFTFCYYFVPLIRRSRRNKKKRSIALLMPLFLFTN